MKWVVSARDEEAPSKSLSARDLCFVKVTCLHEVLPEILTYLEELIEQEDANLVENIINANALFVGALKGVKPVGPAVSLIHSTNMTRHFVYCN